MGNPKEFSNVDDSDSAENWVQTMRYIASLPSVIQQRKTLCNLLDQGTAYNNILLAGCGTGDMAEPLLNLNASSNANLVAFDFSEAMLNHAKQHYTHEKIAFHQLDVCDLPFNNGEFDLVWAEKLIHHVENTEKAIDELCRVLSPSGKLVICEPFVPNVTISQLKPEEIAEYSATWAKNVASGYIGLTIDDTLAQKGLIAEKSFASDLFLRSYKDVTQFIDLPEFLRLAGWSESRVQKQIERWQEADKAQRFRLSFPLFNYIYTYK